MTDQNGKSADDVPVDGGRPNTEMLTPFGQRISLAKQGACDHDWQFDGQTYTAVRWTCTKCFKTKLDGIDI